MKRKTRSLILFAMCFCFIAWLFPAPLLYASDGEYITISVDAADDNGNLQYALDTDDPSAFTDSNEFTILSGTSHIIYVKDVAGNITSQTYTPDLEPIPVEVDVTRDAGKDEQRIDIDLEIGRQNEDEPDYSNYEYLTDDPVEPGTGTVAEKIKTDGSEDSDRIFYTITTKEGEVLYLIVDQGQSSDNVYLLDTVSADDLLALADGTASKVSEPEKEDNLLAALSKEAGTEAEDSNKEASSSKSNFLIIIFILIIGGGVYYYFKIYKNKKEKAMDVMDAMDMDDFEPEEEEEEADFAYDEEEKAAYLEEIINEEENLYDISPEEYADAEENTAEYGSYVGAEEYGLDEEEQEQEEQGDGI